MMTSRLLVLAVVFSLSACAEAPEAPSPEGTENPAETPVETPAGQLTAPGQTAVGAEPGVPGSDRPEAGWQDGAATCYAYAGYVVRAMPRAGAPGEDVTVFRRSEGDLRPQCQAAAGSAVFRETDAESATHFFGLVGGLLLLDQGTGPNGRHVRVVDLTSGTPVYDAAYEEPIEVEDGALVYGMEPEIADSMEEVQRYDVPCPDAAEWFDQGLSVGLSPRMRYDFAARAAAPTGDVLCIPIQ